MKSIGAIKHKLNQVRFRHLKKRLELDLKQVPCNCIYNVSIPQMEESVSEGYTVCMFGAGDILNWKPSFCDERLDAGLRARSCPSFCSRRTKEDVKKEFQQDLEQMSLPEVAYHYPDMAALLWVLDASDIKEVSEDTLEEEELILAPILKEPLETQSVSEEKPVSEVGALTLTAPKKPWYAKLLDVL